MGELTAGGRFQLDPGLTKETAEAFQGVLVAALRSRGVPARRADGPTDGADPQLIVALSDLQAMVHEAGLAPYRTSLYGRPVRFAAALEEFADADYALVGVVSGAYSTSGRRLTQAAGAAMAVGIGVGVVPSGGGQYAVLGLYDLRGDRLVWIHKDQIGRPSLRTEAGLETVADRLLEPLNDVPR